MPDFDFRIEIVFYSGYKGRETPRAIRVGTQEYPVEKVLSRKRVQVKDSGERYEFFCCRAAGKEITLKIGPSGECRIVASGPDPLFPQK